MYLQIVLEPDLVSMFCLHRMKILTISTLLGFFIRFSLVPATYHIFLGEGVMFVKVTNL